MAIKTVCAIVGYSFEGFEIAPKIQITGPEEGQGIGSVVLDPMDLTSTPAQINAAVLAAAQSYAETEWSVSFTPLIDSVRLVNPVGAL